MNGEENSNLPTTKAKHTGEWLNQSEAREKLGRKVNRRYETW